MDADPKSEWKLNREKVADLLLSPDTHVTTLVVILSKLLATNPAEEEVEVLFAGVQSEFGFELPSALKNKLAAWQVAVETPLFYNNPETFLAVSATLSNGALPDGLDFDEHDLHDMMWALYEIGLTYGDHEPDVGRAVERLIRHAAAAEGETAQEDGTNWYDRHIEAERNTLHTELLLAGAPPAALTALFADA